LFNQQQCFIYSTASFLSKLRAKKVEKLHDSHKTASKQMTAYRKFRKCNIGIRNGERQSTISGFADSKKKKKKKKKINADRLTLDFFDM
jgi:hypothetical protein